MHAKTDYRYYFCTMYGPTLSIALIKLLKNIIIKSIVLKVFTKVEIVAYRVDYSVYAMCTLKGCVHTGRQSTLTCSVPPAQNFRCTDLPLFALFLSLSRMLYYVFVLSTDYFTADLFNREYR